MGSFTNTDWLIELDFRVHDAETGDVTTTVLRWSKFKDRTVGGHTYTAAIKNIGDIQLMYMDVKHVDFDEQTFTIRNLSNFTGDFPITVLRASANFWLKRVRIYRYDGVTATQVWWGYTKSVEFSADTFEATFTASFPWDAIKVMFPINTMSHRCQWNLPTDPLETETGDVTGGCSYNPGGGVGVVPAGDGSATFCSKSPDPDDVNGCAAKGMLQYFGGFTKIAPVLEGTRNNWIDRSKVRDAPVPLLYGVGALKIRPEVYRAQIIDGILMVNFVISGCHRGQPFEPEDFGVVRLAGAQKARYVVFYVGDDAQRIPANRTKFPEGLGHSLVCYGYAEFLLTDDQKTKFANDVPFHAVTIRMNNGRKTKAGFPTNNHVVVIKDYMSDPVWGLGIPDSDWDEDFISDAAALNPFTGRFEFDKQVQMFDWIKSMCQTAALYITWNNDKTQIGKKHNAETAVATFGTDGYRIIDFNEVNIHEDQVTELTNTYNIKYREKFRNGVKFQWYDNYVRRAAGGGRSLPVAEDVFLEGIYDAFQAQVSAATMMREEINLPWPGAFKTSVHDFIASGARPGNLIRVNSVHIPNNDSNYLFRIVGGRIVVNDDQVEYDLRLYKPQVYDFDTDALGDLTTTPGDSSTPVYPPDVEDLAATATKVFNDRDDSPMENIHVTWTNPGADIDDDAALQEESVQKQAEPINEIEIRWNYEDFGPFKLVVAGRVKFPEELFDFLLPWHRDRSVRVWAIPYGKDGNAGEVGYVKNPDKTAALAEEDTIGADVTTFEVDDAEAMGAEVGDFIKWGTEYNKISAITGNDITVEADGGNRLGYFNSDPISHDPGDEVAVAEPSHPSVLVELGVNRFTLPVPQHPHLRRRRKGPRFKCDDSNLDTPHHLDIYISPDADALNASFNEEYGPDWYFLDPDNPPESGFMVYPSEGGSDDYYFVDDFNPGDEDMLLDEVWDQERGTWVAKLSSGRMDPAATYVGPGYAPDGGRCGLATVEVPVNTNYQVWMRLSSTPVYYNYVLSYYEGGHSLVFQSDPATGGWWSIDILPVDLLNSDKGFWVLRENFSSGTPEDRGGGNYDFHPAPGTEVLGIVTYDEVHAQNSLTVKIRPSSLYDWTTIAVGVLIGVPITGTLRAGLASRPNGDPTDVDDPSVSPTYGAFMLQAAGATPTPPHVTAFGIKRFPNRDNSRVITWEELAEAFAIEERTRIFARAAYRHKHNHSMLLSKPARRKHSRGPQEKPAAPSPDQITDSKPDGTMTFTIAANPELNDDYDVAAADATFSENDVDADTIIFIFENEDASETKRKRVRLHGRNVTSYDADVEFTPGQRWKWPKTITANSDGEVESDAPDDDVWFTTGGYHGGDGSGDDGGASAPTLTATDPTSGLTVPITFDFTQTSPPSLPNTFTVEEKVSGDVDANYIPKLVENVSGIADLATAGSKTIRRTIEASDYGVTYTYRATLTFTPSASISDTDDATTPSATGGGGASVLDDLGDVDTVTNPPMPGDVLVETGTEWEPVTPTFALLDDYDGSTPPTLGQVLTWDGSNYSPATLTPSAPANVTDGDKGDITVASGVWTIDPSAVTFAKMENAWARTTYPLATASIAAMAGTSGTVPLGKSFKGLAIQVDQACRVRLYSTAAARTADTTAHPLGVGGNRPSDVKPTPGNGVIADFKFDAAETIVAQPEILGSNADTSVVVDIYYYIENLTPSTTIINVTFTYVRLE